MVTIEDVAQAANVAFSTVSRALNNSGYVSPTTRVRVLEAAQRLGYTPNPSARNLKRKVTQRVGLVIPQLTNLFYMSVAEGVLQRAESLGYQVMICPSNQSASREAEYLRSLMRERADGILLMPSGSNRQVLQELVAREIPVVLIDRLASEPSEFDAVLVDNVKGACEATNHLLVLGHRRIGVVCGPQQLVVGRERLLGYMKALQEAGLEPDLDLIHHGPFSVKAGCNAVKELLQSGGATAIFATSNLLVEGAMQGLREMNVRIPDKIALVGWDDEPWASFTSPGITMVAQPTFSIGTAAMQLLLERLAGERTDSAPVITRFETKLIVRESCGARVEESARQNRVAAITIDTLPPQDANERNAL